MDLHAAVDFASTHHRSVMSTRRADGAPQMSPVVHAVDGEGRIMVSTRGPAVKVRNIPRVTLCILSDAFFGSWAQLDGSCEVVELPDAMPLLEEVYRQAAGDHPDWDAFREAMVTEGRVVLRITPDRAGPTTSG